MKKKIISILLAMMAIAVFAGCSPQSVPTPEETAAQGEQEIPPEQSEEPSDAAMEEPTGEESPAPEGEVEALAGETVFGKVKNVVGNEVELELAKPPFEIGTPGDDGSMGGITGSASGATSQQVIVNENRDSAQLSEDAGASAEGGNDSVSFSVATEDGVVQTFGGGENGEKMELEYTGESKSIIIPAGVEIVNMIGGETTMDAVKKGSVLMLTVDESSGTPTATSILIME